MIMSLPRVNVWPTVYTCSINSDDIRVKVISWQPLDDVGSRKLLNGNYLDT